MARSLDPVAAELLDAFVGAYPAYVTERAATLADPGSLGDAVGEGVAWLETNLAAELSLPLGAQRRSPLEIFREALRFPSAALEEAEARPIERDPVTQEVLPGDRFDLAPATSQQLGERAWRAHVAWGLRKAQLVAGRLPRAGTAGEPVPVVAVATVGAPPPRLAVALAGLGYRLDRWGDPEAVTGRLAEVSPVAVVVDLDQPLATDVMAALRRASCPVVGYAETVDDVTAAWAGALGADVTVDAARLVSVIGERLPKVV